MRVGVRRSASSPIGADGKPVRHHALQGDDGFTLLESIVTITIITFIMGALVTMFVTVLNSSNQARARQMGIQLASSNLEALRGYRWTDLPLGRSTSAVSSQFGHAAPAVQPWLATMAQATDSSTSTATVPVAASTPTINGRPYKVTTYLGWCWVSTQSGSTGVCDLTAQSQSTAVKYLRAVVAVTWTDKHCPANTNDDQAPTCSYITSSLISTADDPVYQVNQSPPAAPVVDTPPDQTTWAVGDQVSLQLRTVDGTGVPTFTWVLDPVTGSNPGPSGNPTNVLPPGLSMNQAGLISGQLQGQVTNLAVRVRVTDAFGRAATGTFKWTILPALTTDNPGAQASIINQTISPNVTITPSGGAGTPYTFSDPSSTLPPGLVLNTVSNKGVISGKPTTIGTFPVTLTVKDSSNTRSTTVSFNWTVDYPPLAVSNPGTQTDTLNNPSNLQLSAAGGNGTYSWSAVGLPAGLSMSASGLVTGTSTTLGTSSVTVTATSGGKTSSQVFNWSIVNRPTITASMPTSSVGAAVSRAVTSSCPNSPCTYSISGQPSGVVISSAGVIGGTINGSAGSFTVTTVITDNDGVTASSSFGWTILARPTITAPSTQTDTVGSAVNLAVTNSCPLSPCTYTLRNAPAGLSINSSGVIVGPMGTTTGTSSNVTVTVTDSAGSAATTPVFTWVVVAGPSVTSPGDLTSSVNSPVNISLTTTCPNSPCTYTMTGGPPGVSISASGVMTGSITGSATTYTAAKITVKDSDNITSTTAAFKWTVASAGGIDGTWPVYTTRGDTPEQPIYYKCTGLTTCTITLSGTSGSGGIGLSKTSGVTTANNTTSVTVSAGTGTVYINGKVSASVAKGNYTLSVSINGTSSDSDSGTWVVS